MIGRRRHLGDLAAALVDGELDHDARDRALSHLAHCAGCRSEVAQQRRLKARLREVGDISPGADLLSRLDTAGRGSRELGHRWRLPRHPVRVAMAGAGGLLAATFATALVVGGGERSAPPVAPPVATYVVEHLATTDQLPLTDPDVGAAAVTVAETAGP